MKPVKGFTPGPWVWGAWTIFDEDRQAQKEGKPYWTLVEPDYLAASVELAQGPIGRKAMYPVSLLRAIGYECDGIDVSKENAELIAQAPDMYEENQRLRKLAVEGWYKATAALGGYAFSEEEVSPWLKSHGVDQDIIKAVIEEIIDFKIKCAMRSEEP